MTLINVRNLGVTLNAPLFSQLNLVVNAGDRIGCGVVIRTAGPKARHKPAKK